MKRKILSIVLSAVMIITALPAVVFAGDGPVAQIGDTEYTTLQEAVTAVRDNETIILLENTTVDSMIENLENKTFTMVK